MSNDHKKLYIIDISKDNIHIRIKVYFARYTPNYPRTKIIAKSHFQEDIELQIDILPLYKRIHESAHCLYSLVCNKLFDFGEIHRNICSSKLYAFLNIVDFVDMQRELWQIIYLIELIIEVRVEI